MSDTLAQNTGGQTAAEILDSVGYTGFVRALFNRSGDPAKDFTHAILGVVTEIYELRAATEAVNVLEEAGDIAFYIEALSQVVADYRCNQPASTVREDFEGVLVGRSGTTASYVDSLCNQLLDDAKRWVGYGKVPDDLIISAYTAFLASELTTLDCNAQFDERTLMLANIGKLLKRYNGMAFNAERAVNRDLAAEREVLEHAATV